MPAALKEQQDSKKPVDEDESNLFARDAKHPSFTLKQGMHLATAETTRTSLVLNRQSCLRVHLGSQE